MSCRFVVFIDPFRCHVTAPSHIEAGPDLGGGGGGGGNRGSCQAVGPHGAHNNDIHGL